MTGVQTCALPIFLSDLVKFAKEKPIPADNELSMESAISFVTDTQQSAPRVNTEGGSEDV